MPGERHPRRAVSRIQTKLEASLPGEGAGGMAARLPGTPSSLCTCQGSASVTPSHIVDGSRCFLVL